MARILGLFPSALIAAREGMSANAFYRELRSLDVAARRAEVLALYGIARGIIARSPDESFADIRQTPTANELTPWPTRKATGVAQNIAITYRERSTGTLSMTWYTVKSENGIPREQALAMAVDAYSSSAERYNQDLIGAIHTSARRYVPIEGA